MGARNLTSLWMMLKHTSCHFEPYDAKRTSAPNDRCVIATSSRMMPKSWARFIKLSRTYNHNME